MKRLIRSRILLWPLLLVAGCADGGKPFVSAFRAQDAGQALSILKQRTALTHTASAQCQITLTRGPSQEVQFDGILAMQPPDRLRIRAFKFGQAVFDLTLRPDGLWIEAGESQGAREQIIPATLDAARLAHELLWLTGGFFTLPGLTVDPADTHGAFVYRRQLDDGSKVVCEVDRSMIVPIRYRLFDPAGAERFVLELGDYQDVNTIPWAMRWAGYSVLSPGPHPPSVPARAMIQINLSGVELNGELGTNAFVPPRRAEKKS